MSLQQSKTITAYAKACTLMPWGVSSNFRYWGTQTPVVSKARGAYIWDVDGNRYIDYRLAFGPIILGHADPRVNQRVATAIEDGVLFAHTHLLELDVAERMVRMCPGVELVRFANSGTEATMHAIRIARAYTNREKIIKFEGQYHGFHDYVLFSTAYTPWGSLGSRCSPLSVQNSSGIPAYLRDLIISLPYNDFEMVENTVRARWGEIAAILVEPIAGNMTSILPVEGWLHHLRKLCDDYGIVFIVDEVKTGFRIAKGGATEYFGVKGDIMTYAKSLANGFPLAAIGGKKNVMNVIEPGRMAHGGTYCGNGVGTAAASATLDILENTSALEKIANQGKRLMEGIHQILERKDLPHALTGHPAMFVFLLGVSQSPREYRDVAKADMDLYEKIAVKMRDRGIEYELDAREPWFLCEAHSDIDIDETLNKLEDSLSNM